MAGAGRIDGKDKSTDGYPRYHERKIDRDFLYFSPIGATLGRKERHIGFVESNYMSTMGH